MDFAFDERTEQLRDALLALMHAHVYPVEPEFERTDPEAPFSWERTTIMAELRAEARRRDPLVAGAALPRTISPRPTRTTAASAAETALALRGTRCSR